MMQGQGDFMIAVHCTCGEVYQADDDKVGYSIICTKCERLLDVKDASCKPIYVYKPKHKQKLPTLVIAVFLLLLAGIIGYGSYNMRQNSVQQAHAKLLPQNASSASQFPQSLSSSSTTYAIEPPLSITSKSVQKTVEVQNNPRKDATTSSNPAANQPYIPTQKEADEVDREYHYSALPAYVAMPVPHDAASLSTGTDITPPIDTSGKSSLTVINGNNEDAVVKLVGASDELSPQVAYRYVYVRARERYTISKIHAGQYSLPYKTGTDWNGQSSFNQGEKHHRFGKILDFEENVSEDSSGAEKSEWSVLTVTLNPVSLGNVRSQTISKADFDQVK
jgi:hypothetical protein